MPIKLLSSEQFLFAANLVANRFFFKQKFDARIRRILVIKWDEIGDMATATHVFELLKVNYPNAEITLLCKNFVKSLVEHDPHIDQIITQISDYNKKYDLVVELRGTWQTLFKSFAHKCKYRVGRAEVRAKHRGQQLHEIDTNAAIVQPLFLAKQPSITPRLYFSEQDASLVNDFLQKNKIEKFMILHVGARRVLRQWPLDRFTWIANYVKKEYHMDIVFAGTNDDEAQIEMVKQALTFPSYSFTNGFTLSQFSNLCSQAQFYIGNESGPLHIAAAFRIPLIGLFGPGVPRVFYPRGEKSKVLHHVLTCNPCNQINCVQPTNPCINLIQVTDVMSEIQRMLER